MTFAPPNPTCPPGTLSCDCCAAGYSKTLYLTFTSADCPSLNGLVITLRNTVEDCTSLSAWEGSASAGGCNFDAWVRLGTNICAWRIELNGGSGCIGSGNLIGSGDGATCPFTTQSSTFKFDCICCDRKNVTITLSE